MDCSNEWALYQRVAATKGSTSSFRARRALDLGRCTAALLKGQGIEETIDAGVVDGTYS